MYIPESTQKYNLSGSMLSHSDLAMKAAKGLSYSKRKTNTGHIVCRHLLDMLAEQPSHVALRRRRSVSPGRLKAKRANDKQFMLAF